MQVSEKTRRRADPHQRDNVKARYGLFIIKVTTNVVSDEGRADQKLLSCSGIQLKNHFRKWTKRKHNSPSRVGPTKKEARAHGLHNPGS
ncbi:hypothetical protein EVAR_5639_1 [Eumeta japonica]|uniref:Uncharacterized protein n=1 Tax=Eumeta variegata TaxID=151549 RepID=A0A4C1T7D0_EUMVA|nr:hypothetical protein EVAR_5639_1 [Eumeta japonica]